MPRRFSFWFCCSVFFGSVFQTSSAFAADAQRPNVVFLLTDDLRADCLGCSGHPLLKTPHIDQLASEGVRFQNAFVTTAICCVSRACYVTGQYARHHRVADFNTALTAGQLEQTWPVVLKRAGYRTACFGKWGLGGEEPKALFDMWDAWGGQGNYFHEVGGERVHNSEYLAQRAEEFLRSQPQGRPFCLLVNYKAPHDPLEPDPADMPLFANVPMPVPPTYREEAFAAMPIFIRVSEGRIRERKLHGTPDAFQEFGRNYLRLVAGVDRSVGRIRKVLDELKLSDNTIIVFASDNGFFLGEHGLSHKWLMHEESIRVPVIIRDPRGPVGAKGNVRDELVLNLDLAPTLLDLAGAPIPAAMDGRSLKPLLRGERPEWRKDFFYEHHYHHGGKIPRTEGVREKEWKYITYFDVEPVYEELYNLNRDPKEELNLAGDPASHETLVRLRKRYRQYVRELGPAVTPPGPLPPVIKLDDAPPR